MIIVYFNPKLINSGINVDFLGKNAKYFRNALVLASLYSSSKPEYLLGIVSDSTTAKNQSTNNYETINGYKVNKYAYQNHTVDKMKTIKKLNF